MRRTCRRLTEELQSDVDGHRLLEIETIVRLLVPHMTRAVAESIHAGKASELGDAGAVLVRMRDHLTWVDGHRDAVLPEVRQRLSDSVACAGTVLDVLGRI
jgi:hypothetical protein